MSDLAEMDAAQVATADGSRSLSEWVSARLDVAKPTSSGIRDSASTRSKPTSPASKRPCRSGRWRSRRIVRTSVFAVSFRSVGPCWTTTTTGAASMAATAKTGFNYTMSGHGSRPGRPTKETRSSSVGSVTKSWFTNGAMRSFFHSATDAESDSDRHREDGEPGRDSPTSRFTPRRRPSVSPLRIERPLLRPKRSVSPHPSRPEVSPPPHRRLLWRAPTGRHPRRRSRVPRGR